MYVILGATGNIGTEIVHRLLAKGEKVRAVGRNPEKLRALAAKGAETVSADLHDANALTNALAGARAAFLMIPRTLPPRTIGKSRSASAKPSPRPSKNPNFNTRSF